MGLDSFWEAPDDADLSPPSFDPPLRLCGGMFSGNGDGSFRGKVYNDLVERATGQTLYEDVLSNETVRGMADRLADVEERDRKSGHYDVSADEVRDLKRMFRGYADAGFVLKGWW